MPTPEIKIRSDISVAFSGGPWTDSALPGDEDLKEWVHKALSLPKRELRSFLGRDDLELDLTKQLTKDDYLAALRCTQHYRSDELFDKLGIGGRNNPFARSMSIHVEMPRFATGQVNYFLGLNDECVAAKSMQVTDIDDSGAYFMYAPGNIETPILASLKQAIATTERISEMLKGGHGNARRDSTKNRVRLPISYQRFTYHLTLGKIIGRYCGSQAFKDSDLKYFDDLTLEFGTQVLRQIVRSSPLLGQLIVAENNGKGAFMKHWGKVIAEM